MSKIRINNLARELEVKSKTILDTLPEIGVTEKKTHSSSLEDHEAEKVRAYLRAGSEASVSSKPARPSRDGDEIKTKIDLSHISKPGDVLKAIISKQQPAPAAPARPAPPRQAPVETKPAAPVIPVAKASAPPAAAPAPPKLVVPATGPRPTFTVPVPPSAPQAPAASTSTPPRPAAPPPPPADSTAAAQAQPQAPAASRRPAAPAAPQVPQPRMIVPQTGPRPVYKAPIRPAGSSGAPARPAPGRPVPGQPIFQRPRPAASSPRSPSLRPGERRPMHPTRQSPTGTRPLGVGPGLPPPGSARPGSRPGGPSRRPGQRYIPRGIKEGPMKGFVPPPRLTVSNEPLPITRDLTITEGISVKDLAEKLGIRAKDLIARLLGRGVFATINQTLEAELAGEM